MDNFLNQLKLGLDFKGKTTRKEYWMFVLAHILLMILVSIFTPGLAVLVQLLLFVPGLASLVRRFNDADVTPWAMLLILPIYIVPFMGSR